MYLETNYCGFTKSTSDGEIFHSFMCRLDIRTLFRRFSVAKLLYESLCPFLAKYHSVSPLFSFSILRIDFTGKHCQYQTLFLLDKSYHSSFIDEKKTDIAKRYCCRHIRLKANWKTKKVHHWTNINGYRSHIVMLYTSFWSESSNQRLVNVDKAANNFQIRSLLNSNHSDWSPSATKNSCALGWE